MTWYFLVNITWLDLLTSYSQRMAARNRTSLNYLTYFPLPLSFSFFMKTRMMQCHTSKSCSWWVGLTCFVAWLAFRPLCDKKWNMIPSHMTSFFFLLTHDLVYLHINLFTKNGRKRTWVRPIEERLVALIKGA